jgi:peptidoglycan/xylan/chitin deacetylase (PgdA/CDA1 family)
MLTLAEIKELASLGVDIQLHTHRHHMPRDADLLRREIEENRAVLNGATGLPCDHLCYPSGAFHEEQWEALAAASVISGTTCEPGLNDKDTPLFGLYRYLDAEHLADIEIEAALSGLVEILSRIWSRLTGRRKLPSRGVAPGQYGH